MGEPAARGVVELVGGAQPGVAAGPRRGADEGRAAVPGVVQLVDLDVPEDTGLLAGLPQLLDHALPDGHRGPGVHEQQDGPRGGGRRGAAPG